MVRKSLTWLQPLLVLALLAGCGAPALDSTSNPASATPPVDTSVIAASSPAVTHQPVDMATAAAPALTPTGPPDGEQDAEPGDQASEPQATQEAEPSSLPPMPGPVDWQQMPVVPVIDEAQRLRLQEIYQRGIALGNNPHAFSKVGDCGSTPSWFLGDFDRGPRYYRLGEHTYLEPVIAYYQGSFARTSLAAKAGFTTASVLTPLWADRKQCEANESPLACEYRLHRPTIALITLGTNDIWHADEFEPQLREIIEYSIEQGIIPVLSTKADNLEGDGSLNATIHRLAQEYQVPLWNYWLAVQPLPDQGLQDDGAHITFAGNRFDDPSAMEKGWPWRNLTALQVLDAVWQSLENEETSP